MTNNTWNYRFVQVGDTVGVYEVHYKDDEPIARTENPVSLYNETGLQVMDDLEQILRDLEKNNDILDDSLFPEELCEMCGKPTEV